MLETNNYVRCLTIDFSKAFDVVNRSVLLHKVSALELPDSVHNWIVSFLIGRRQICAVSLLTGSAHLSYLFLAALFKDQVLGLPSTLF